MSQADWTENNLTGEHLSIWRSHVFASCDCRLQEMMTAFRVVVNQRPFGADGKPTFRIEEVT